MAENSKIEWTDHTANLWWGCTEVHAGCDHCYARTLARRWGFDIWGNDKPRRLIESVFKDLARYQSQAKAAGVIKKVFVGSMMDIFEKPKPLINTGKNYAVDYSDGSLISNEFLRERLFNEVVPASPNLMFLLLTKRPSNINKYIPESWKTSPPGNVMFGTSPVDQATAEKLIPQLLRVNGKRFLSVEPMLGRVYLNFLDAEKGGDKEWCRIDALTGRQTDMARPCPDVPKIDWVICGGESGHGKRPFNMTWARNLRDQCAAASVPFFMKQIDKVIPIPDDLMVRQFPFVK